MWMPFAVVWTTVLLAPQTRAFEQNPLTHPVAEVFEFNAFDDDADHLRGPYFESLNCIELRPGQMCERVATVSPDEDGNVFVELPDIDDAQDAAAVEDAYAEVAAYFHADRFYAHLFEYDVPPPLCFDQGLPLTLVVNVRGPADEDGIPGWFGGAFFTRDCERGIVLGQAERADLAYDGDLVYHEVAHAAIDALSGEDVYLDGSRALPIAVGNDPAALNEGTADFLSAAFTGDPMLGEYIEEYAGLGRRLDHDIGCPETLVGERHLDGRAWAAALYSLWEKHGDAFYAAVLDTAAALPSDADFSQASAILQDMVGTRLGSAAVLDVEATLEARGLHDCDRVLEAEAVEEQYLIPDPDFTPFRPAPVQLELPTLDVASTVTLRYIGTQFGDDWTIEALVGRGAPVAFDYDETTAPTTVSHDAMEVLDGSEGLLTLEVEPDEPVYLSLFNAGADLIVLRDFEVEVEALDTPSDTDTDTDDAAVPTQLDDDGGCACRSSPNTSARVGWLLLLAACGFGRPRGPSRRRRGSRIRSTVGE